MSQHPAAPDAALPRADALALTPALRAETRAWAVLAVGSLAVAGALAILLGLSRTPRVQDLLPWDWQSFFHKALITHVVFSFVVWFLAALGGLAVLATARAALGAPRWAGLGRAGLGLGFLGAALLLIPTLADSGEPSINNYVPVLVHPLYYAGLGLLAAGVALPVLRLLAQPSAEPLAFGVAMTGAAYLVALLCIGLAWAAIPPGSDIANLNERLFWGGGHVLQFVNTGLMLCGWYVLAGMVWGAAPISPALFRLLMASLLVFVLPTPWFYRLDVMGLAHRDAFTDLLWYGLAAQPALFAVALLVRLAEQRHHLPWRDPAFAGLVLSLAIFLLGGLFGFFLGVGDTRTPSHYHAVIGGVNLALMALIFVFVLPLLGRAGRGGRAIIVTLYLYGIGQTVWSVGMFLAGLGGVPRKTAGAAQGLDSLGKIAAMGIVGIGLVVAVAGGASFVVLALRRLAARERP